MIENFKNVSIRGRVAYAICCLENVIEQVESQPKEDWDVLLNKLWSLTDLQFVDGWLYSVSSSMPSSILEDPFDPEEETTKEEYEKLKALYQSSNQSALDLIEQIFSLGTVELYGKIENNSPRTLEILDEIIELTKSTGAELPTHSLVSKFSIHDSEGWGVRFSKSDLTG